MQPKEKPYVLYVAEIIYSKICQIKNKNPELSNIDAVETFIGSETYKKISSGKFHDEWFDDLKKNNFVDKKSKKKIPDETLRLLEIQKETLESEDFFYLVKARVEKTSSIFKKSNQ